MVCQIPRSRGHFFVRLKSAIISSLTRPSWLSWHHLKILRSSSSFKIQNLQSHLISPIFGALHHRHRFLSGFLATVYVLIRDTLRESVAWRTRDTNVNEGDWAWRSDSLHRSFPYLTLNWNFQALAISVQWFFLRLRLQTWFVSVALDLKGARSHDASDQMCSCWRRVGNPFWSYELTVWFFWGNSSVDATFKFYICRCFCCFTILNRCYVKILNFLWCFIWDSRFRNFSNCRPAWQSSENMSSLACFIAAPVFSITRMFSAKTRN